VNPGQELPPRSRTVTREDIAAYAEAGGDRNPIHLSDEAAVAAGLESGIIAHGMFTFGHMAATLADWLQSSDPIVNISGQFRAMVRPGDTITAGGTVRSIEGDTATLDLFVTVQSADGTAEAVRRGEATIRLA
jgi:acyl dehydratase